MGRAIAAAVICVLAVAACGGTDRARATDAPSPATTSPPAATTTVPATASPATTAPTAAPPAVTAPPTTAPVVDVPAVLADFLVGPVLLDGRQLTVAIADTSELRARGLMFVEDLLSLDGMVFIWPADTETRFWMKDTLMDLDIAWFDAEGRFVSMFTMLPCGDRADCPRYEAAGPYRFALEMRAGTMPELGEDSRLGIADGF